MAVIRSESSSRSVRRAALVCVGVGSLLLGCGGGGEGDTALPTPVGTSSSSSTLSTSPTASATGTRTPTPVGTGPVKVARTIATGLSAPWGLAFLPDGTALVSERDRGRIVQVGQDGGLTPVGTVPGVSAAGEGGLLGIAVAPTFATDSYVFAYFTGAEDNRVVRMRYEPSRPAGNRLDAPQTLLTGIEKSSIHNGGRIAFGPDGLLYVSTGDANDRTTAQDDLSLNGKILRLNPSGSAAAGNPNGDPVYSKGHRNVQGLAWDSRGQLWASEFGQNTYDELNLIKAGGNYGWPTVEGPSNDSRFTAPQATWRTDDASPSGLAISGDVAYLAGLKGQRLWQVPIAGSRAGTPVALFNGAYGRLRTVSVAPDGSLWLITGNTDGRGNPRSGDDRILQLTRG